jgi:hypothetical protein
MSAIFFESGEQGIGAGILFMGGWDGRSGCARLLAL